MLIGLDIGSWCTRMSLSGKGVVISEATLLADCVNLPQAVAVGQTVVPILAKHPAHVRVFRPVERGHLAAPGAAAELIRNLLNRTGVRGWKRPRVRVVTPSQASPLERYQLKAALQAAGVTQVEFVAAAVACAHGCPGGVSREKAVAVVDIGATTTEMALVSPEIVLREHIRWGGMDLDRAIEEALHRMELEVSVSVAERAKIAVGCLDPEDPDVHPPTIDISGRDRSTGLPRRGEVGSRILRESLEQPLEHLYELIRRVLDQLPPLLAKDILDRGICLTGGGAMLRGLTSWLQHRLSLTVKRSDDPQHCAVLGALLVDSTLCKEE